MSDMVRFGVSMSADLLANLDDLLEKIGYTSRSEAIRDMVRSRRVREIADRLISTRGVKHGRLTTTTTGKRMG